MKIYEVLRDLDKENVEIKSLSIVKKDGKIQKISIQTKKGG